MYRYVHMNFETYLCGNHQKLYTYVPAAEERYSGEHAYTKRQLDRNAHHFHSVRVRADRWTAFTEHTDNRIECRKSTKSVQEEKIGESFIVSMEYMCLYGGNFSYTQYMSWDGGHV